MLTLSALLFLLLRLVFDNKIVLFGATRGLMLWYQQLLPLLLPFLLLSSLFTLRVSRLTAKNEHTSHTIFAILILGILCGCPIGAKTTAEFFAKQKIDRTSATLILPLCNNISPMFLAGYITVNILHNQIPFLISFVLIYIPYILYVCIACLIQKKMKKKNQKIDNEYFGCTVNELPGQSEDLLLKSVIQITYIGIYVMLCSTIIEFITVYAPIKKLGKLLLACLTEITIGTSLLAPYTGISIKIKTALILACTSFGGISTLLQTEKMLAKSGLSMIYYTVVKLICATATFGLTLLVL